MRAGIRDLKALARKLKAEGFTTEEILRLLPAKDSVPATIFSTGLSPLQSLVTYLLKSHDLRQISTLISRKYRAVWGAKTDQKIEPEPTRYFIPLSAFNNRLSVLETVVKHLRDSYDLRYSQIAKLLGKDQRTIWTVYARAGNK